MVDLLRELVSGKRKRYTQEGYNLDLTYICERVIGMSFPASGFIESKYRNPIEDVANFLIKKHGEHFLIFNLSGRTYQYAKFNGKVNDFPWQDHHSPPIDVLFRLCDTILRHLRADLNNVAVLHCLAGKGRIGTAICCFLLYSGRFDTADEAMSYYASKRFSEGGGVTQPSQRRYVKYFEQILKSKEPFIPKLLYVKSIEFHTVPRFGLDNSCKPCYTIYSVKDNTTIFSNKKANELLKYRQENADSEGNVMVPPPGAIPLLGDVLFNFYNNGTLFNDFMFRCAFSTAFIDEQKDLILTLRELDPDSTIKNKQFDNSFFVKFSFARGNVPQSESSHIDREQQCWNEIQKLLTAYKRPTVAEAQITLFREPSNDDVQETLAKSLHISLSNSLNLKSQILTPSPVVIGGSYNLDVRRPMPPAQMRNDGSTQPTLGYGRPVSDLPEEEEKKQGE